MFVISLTYLKPLEQIEAQLGAHRDFLRQQYGMGIFLMSGRKVPRDGGVILADAETREEIEAVIRLDPFHAGGLARYDITEFVPTMTADAFAAFREE
ncbi:MAG: YciI family protein [Pseudomonadota bacterium]